MIVLIICLATVLRLRFGGGTEYENLSTEPLYDKHQLELFFSHPEPIGNIAVSKTVDSLKATRVFFTIHPESRPQNSKLIEIVNGQALPYPNQEMQDQFVTILGIYSDLQNRLWVLDYGNHGIQDVKLTAFDLNTNHVCHEFTFPSDVAKLLSNFNDLSVSMDGQKIVISNTSFFGRNPSLIAYNLATGESKNLLENHASVEDEGYVPVTPAKKMSFLGGLVDLRIGIDGIDFSRNGEFVYYAGMCHSSLFRVPTNVLFDFSLSAKEVADAVEFVCVKPISDGIRSDNYGNIYITDIEHQGIYIVNKHGHGRTLIKDERIRWADGLSLSANNMIYLADSDIPNQILQSKQHIRKSGPYHIFRFPVYHDIKE